MCCVGVVIGVRVTCLKLFFFLFSDTDGIRFSTVLNKSY